MTTKTQNLQLFHRKTTGKKVRFLRRKGIIPVHLFGSGIDSSHLQVELASLSKILESSGRNIPVQVQIEDDQEENICFIREVQRHPVTEDILHVDFLRVESTQLVTTEVPVVMIGEAPGVRNLGGILLQSLQSVLTESLPVDMPASFEIDVSILEDFETSIRVGDLPTSENFKILVDDYTTIARVLPPRVEEEEVIEQEGEEDEEGEESEDGQEGQETDDSSQPDSQN